MEKVMSVFFICYIPRLRSLQLCRIAIKQRIAQHKELIRRRTF